MSWKKIEDFIKNNNEEINKIRTNEIIGKEKIQHLNEWNLDIKKQNDFLIKQIEEKKENISELKNEIIGKENKLKILTEKNQDKEIDLTEYKQKIENLTNEINKRKHENEKLERNIHDKLIPLDKIEKTFFAKTGNKGKAELGERQLKTFLEKSGLDKDFWIENLQVGSSSVEFAIRLNDENKWIPIDSKVLETNIDKEGNAIIDDDYKRKVIIEANKITKYISKKNTADYGLLVLQSDSIYIKLYEKYPLFFQEIIQNYRIHICSPSSFIQFAWSISHILDIYKKVSKDKKIYDQMLTTLSSISILGRKLNDIHKDFNIAIKRHYPALEKKSNKLLKSLKNEGKIKELPSLKTIDNIEDKE